MYVPIGEALTENTTARSFRAVYFLEVKAMKKTQTRRLTESAMMIALSTVISFVCSLIPVVPFNFPFGGGITIAGMLPVILIGYMYGTRWGLLTAFSYSLIQMLLGHSTVSSLFLPVEEGGMTLAAALVVLLVDYVLAYTVLGLGGLFKSRMTPGRSLLCGVLLTTVIRYACHILSGTIFYGAWAQWFFEQPGIYEAIGEKVLSTFGGVGLSLVYSVVYNGCYMIPEIILTGVCALLVVRIPAISKRAEANIV